MVHMRFSSLLLSRFTFKITVQVISYCCFFLLCISLYRLLLHALVPRTVHILYANRAHALVFITETLRYMHNTHIAMSVPKATANDE